MANRGRKTRTKAEREAHLAEVARLYCRGVPQYKIAEDRGVDPSQITYDMRILMGRWQKASTAQIDERKASELEKIDQLEREYWEAWQDSIASAVKVSKERKVGGEVVTVKQEVTKASGDARFLQGVQWCIDRRCKLLGLDATVKSETTIKVPDDPKNRIAQLLSRISDAESEDGADREPER